MKRFLLVLFALTYVGVLVSHAQFYTVNGIFYDPIDDNSLIVVASSSSSYSGEITIPNKVTIECTGAYGDKYKRTFTVVGIGEEAFRGCSRLTAITLPSSITSIGKNAFYDCSGLTRVNIPDRVSSIGMSAFGNCSSLTSIQLPNSVTSLGANAFYGCSSLASATLPSSLTVLTGTFHGCSSLTSIDIPASVKTLDGTFAGCTHLNEVHLPKSLSVIGDNTFADCAALTSIYLPDMVNQIGDMAFANTGLTAIELPDVVTSLGENAFYGSSQLMAVTVRATNPPLMSNIDGFSNETYGLAPLAVPEVSLTAYQSADWWRLFQNKDGKESLNVHYDFEAGGLYYIITGPNTVDVTYKDENYNSYSGSIYVPMAVTHDGVTYSVTGIGNSAFRNCTSLTGLSLPSTIKTIGNYAFYCAGLTGLNLPVAVASIGEFAFYGCTGLQRLTIPVNVTSIGENAFANGNLTSLTWNARECWTNGDMLTTSLTQITIGNEVRVLPPRFAYQSAITSVEIPESVTAIGDQAFYQCSGITTLTIPVNVVYIGSSAFYGTRVQSLTWNARECWSYGGITSYSQSSLAPITIGDQVEVLPPYFAIGTAITSITIPSSVKYIGYNAFSNCRQLTTVTIPDSVTVIDDYAFYYCNRLGTIHIGKSVNYIGLEAFARYASGSTTDVQLTWDARHCETVGRLFSSRSFTQLTIGDEVEWIPKYFGNYAVITSIDIPASVKTISDEAFEHCSSLTEVILPNSVETIGQYAFYGCSALRSIYIPASVTSLANNAFGYCRSLTSIVVDEANPVYDSRDHCNAIIETASNALMKGCKRTVIPQTVTALRESSFNDCDGMTSITIPPSVTSFGSYAFESCSDLTSVTLPNSDFSMGYYVFSLCPAMNTVTCHAVTVPDIQIDAFFSWNQYYTQQTLFVPAESIDAYRAHREWGRFNSIVPFIGAGPGDIDGDGTLSITDLTELLDMLLNNEWPEWADVNGDGVIGIGDATSLIDMILSRGN